VINPDRENELKSRGISIIVIVKVKCGNLKFSFIMCDCGQSEDPLLMCTDGGFELMAGGEI
jgi:hypothetical protein